jgi:hypothetical protein
VALSEERELSARGAGRARRRAADFLAQERVGYVVIDGARVSPQLREFAITLLNLRRIESSGRYEVYVPDAVMNGR